MAEANSSRRCAHCDACIEGKSRQALYCGSRCKWAAKQKRVPSRSPLREVACCGCGVTTVRRMRADEAGRYCSRRCNTDAMVRVAVEKEALARIGLAWAWRPSAVVVAEAAALRRIGRRKERQYRTMRGCSGCGVEVVGILNWRRKCPGCKALAHRRQVRIAKAARKARIKGGRREPIDPIAVFERDGWRCYLCGIATPKFLRGTCEANAPELEHKLALANGGTHTWDNVACACRACNQAKGARLAA